MNHQHSSLLRVGLGLGIATAAIAATLQGEQGLTPDLADLQDLQDRDSPLLPASPPLPDSRSLLDSRSPLDSRPLPDSMPLADSSPPAGLPPLPEANPVPKVAPRFTVVRDTQPDTQPLPRISGPGFRYPLSKIPAQWHAAPPAPLTRTSPPPLTRTLPPLTRALPPVLHPPTAPIPIVTSRTGPELAPAPVRPAEPVRPAALVRPADPVRPARTRRLVPTRPADPTRRPPRTLAPALAPPPVDDSPDTTPIYLAVGEHVTATTTPLFAATSQELSTPRGQHRADPEAPVTGPSASRPRGSHRDGWRVAGPTPSRATGPTTAAPRAPRHRAD